jgi:DNA polymerase-3 subunit alpha
MERKQQEQPGNHHMQGFTRVIVLDLETTGLPMMKGFNEFHAPNHQVYYDAARVIQIAWQIIDVAASGDSKLVSQENHYILPAGLFYIHPKAALIHGITLSTVKSRGNDLSTVLRFLQRDLHGVTTFVGHNVDFDFNVLVSELLRIDTQHALVTPLYSLRRVCTMQSSTAHCKLFRPGGGYKWPKLAELFVSLFPGRKFLNAHDALGDVIVTSLCYVELVRLGLME